MSQELYKNFEIISVNEWGYPDLLEYNGDGYSLISWWVIILKNKKSKKFRQLRPGRGWIDRYRPCRFRQTPSKMSQKPKKAATQASTIRGRSGL